MDALHVVWTLQAASSVHFFKGSAHLLSFVKNLEIVNLFFFADLQQNSEISKLWFKRDESHPKQWKQEYFLPKVPAETSVSFEAQRWASQIELWC